MIFNIILGFTLPVKLLWWFWNSIQSQQYLLLIRKKYLLMEGRPMSECFFLNCYLAVPQPTLGYYQGDSLTHLMFKHCIFHFQHKGHQEPLKEVGSLNLVEHLTGFELECLNWDVSWSIGFWHSGGIFEVLSVSSIWCM